MWTREKPDYLTHLGNLQDCVLKGDDQHQAHQQVTCGESQGVQHASCLQGLLIIIIIISIIIIATCGEEFQIVLGSWPPASSQRALSLTDSAHSDEAEEERVQIGPIWLHRRHQECRKEEEEGDGHHREEEGVNEDGMVMRKTPVNVQVADRSMSDNREKEAGEEGEEEEGKGNPKGAVEDTKEFGFI